MLFNNELSINCPDGFHIMDEEEKKKFAKLGEANVLCFSNPEKHMVFVVGAKQLNAFVRLVLNPADIAKNMYKCIVRGNKPYGIKAGKPEKTIIAGTEAEGFDYSYTVQDIGMSASSYSLLKGKNAYYIHKYVRSAYEAEGREIWNRFVSELAFKD